MPGQPCSEVPGERGGVRSDADQPFMPLFGRPIHARQNSDHGMPIVAKDPVKAADLVLPLQLVEKAISLVRKEAIDRGVGDTDRWLLVNLQDRRELVDLRVKKTNT